MSKDLNQNSDNTKVVRFYLVAGTLSALNFSEKLSSPEYRKAIVDAVIKEIKGELTSCDNGRRYYIAESEYGVYLIHGKKTLKNTLYPALQELVRKWKPYFAEVRLENVSENYPIGLAIRSNAYTRIELPCENSEEALQSATTIFFDGSFQSAKRCMDAIKESNPEAFLTISYKSEDASENASDIDGIVLHALVKDPNKERETVAISFIENTEIHLPLQYYANPIVGKLILRDFSVSMNLEPITKTQDNSSFTFIDLPKDTPVVVSEAIRVSGLINNIDIPLESFEGKLLHALYDSIYFKGDCNTYKKLLVNIIERDACDYSQTLEDVQSSASLLKAYGIQLTDDMFIEGMKHYVVKMTYRETGDEALCFAVDYTHLSRLLPILDKARR